jgi:hypothetical protein
MDDRDESGKFIKGRSGNPDGRPRGSLSIKDTIRQYLGGKVKDIDPALIAQIAGKDKLFAKKYGDKKLHEALAIAYIREGLKGDFRLLEQMEGKPAQNVNLGGQEDNPVKVQFEYIDPKADEE